MERRKPSGLPEDLFIPKNERELRRVQRAVDKLDRNVRGWAASVVDILPKGLNLLREEVEILRLYLARQRRLNLELDSKQQPETLSRKLASLLPIPVDDNEPRVTLTAHRMAETHLVSDLERTYYFFCEDRNIPPICDQAIDWCVAIRSMAQQLYPIASSFDIKRAKTNPLRFELRLVARDDTVDVIGKRHRMLDLFSNSSESV